MIVIGPDGEPVEPAPQAELDQADRQARALTDLVQQPAKVMRIGSMIKQLLEEVKAAPLDEAARSRLKSIHEQSVHELQDGLAPNWWTSCNAYRCLSPTAPRPAMPSCASPRHNSWGGSKGFSTAFRRLCSRSR